MDKEHTFERPAMTPEEFGTHLSGLVSRLVNDDGFRDLSFINRHHVQALDLEYGRMVEAWLSPDRTER